MGPMNRRDFLRGSLGAATMAAVLPQRSSRAASDKVIFGVMGLGGRGSQLARMSTWKSRWPTTSGRAGR